VFGAIGQTLNFSHKFSYIATNGTVSMLQRTYALTNDWINVETNDFNLKGVNPIGDFNRPRAMQFWRVLVSPP
jgi:hypothetical protein